MTTIDFQHLEDIVGAENITFDRETCKSYSTDVAALPHLVNQILKESFDLVIQPVTVDSLLKLVEFASRNRIPLVPRGNSTSGWGGAISSRGGICVGLTQMSGVLTVDYYGLKATVNAGITWRELHLFLTRLGLTIPVYPSSATAATVGGFVASGGIGIGSAGYGQISDQILGIEAVLANGKLVRLGELLLESDSEDLKELAIEGNSWLEDQLKRSGLAGIEDPKEVLQETFGTLGIITKVTLKVIPKLQLLPFVFSFENMNDLSLAVGQIIESARPYHMRFLTGSYSSKLLSSSKYRKESGKFILTGALQNNEFQNEEDLEKIIQIVQDNSGIALDYERALYYWRERFYPLRIKRQGPSLVPAELLVPTDRLPDLLEGTKRKLLGSRYAIEGTFDNIGSASFLVWILDDERKKLAYTMGWHRSFEIVKMAKQFGGKPYAVGLWNVTQAKQFYGEKKFKSLKKLKRIIDPKQILNPMKVFGGRVEAGKESLFLGFAGGTSAALVLMVAGNALMNQAWLSAFLQSIPLQPFQIPMYIFLALGAGILGIGFIKLMSIQIALRLGVPILKYLSKIVNRLK